MTPRDWRLFWIEQQLRLYGTTPKAVDVQRRFGVTLQTAQDDLDAYRRLRTDDKAP